MGRTQAVISNIRRFVMNTVLPLVKHLGCINFRASFFFHPYIEKTTTDCTIKDYFNNSIKKKSTQG